MWPGAWPFRRFRDSARGRPPSQKRERSDASGTKYQIFRGTIFPVLVERTTLRPLCIEPKKFVKLKFLSFWNLWVLTPIRINHPKDFWLTCVNHPSTTPKWMAGMIPLSPKVINTPALKGRHSDSENLSHRDTIMLVIPKAQTTDR